MTPERRKQLRSWANKKSPLRIREAMERERVIIEDPKSPPILKQQAEERLEVLEDYHYGRIGAGNDGNQELL